MRTALSGAENNRVGTRLEVELHRDANDDIAASRGGLVKPNLGPTVDAARYSDEGDRMGYYEA